jgi:hypothetical protein
MDVTVAGMLIEVIVVTMNAAIPMVKSPLPAVKVTDARLEACVNALSPMDVTDAGILMEIIRVPRNAIAPMAVTVSGISI